MKVEIEVDSLQQLEEVLAHPGGADAILLDNFSTEQTRAAVLRTAGRVQQDSYQMGEIHGRAEVRG